MDRKMQIIDSVEKVITVIDDTFYRIEKLEKQVKVLNEKVKSFEAYLNMKENGYEPAN
jgi:hypothetical protein